VSRRRPGRIAIAAVFVVVALAISSRPAGASPAFDAESGAAVRGALPSLLPSTPQPYWTNLTIPPADQPSPQDEGNFVWDSTGGYGLLFGGEYNNPVTSQIDYYNITWTFLHGAWTNVTSATAPSARWGTILSDDPAEGGVLLFGGAQYERTPSPHSIYLNDTWLWDSTGWHNITPSHSPVPTYWASMAYDPTLGGVVLFGGGNNLTPAYEYTNETWLFSGGVWTQLHPTTSPEVRRSQQMVYDAAAGAIVMFGGDNDTVYFNDTWTFSSGNWAEVSDANHPGARYAAGFAYDTRTGQVELFGGQPAPDDYYATWFFSDGQWAEYNLTPVPTNPSNPWERMTFDPTDNYTVLFYTPEAQAWSDTWTLTVPAGAVPPPPLHVGLTAQPASISWKQSTTFTTTVDPAGSGDTFVYSTVPTGCTGRNASSFVCTPSLVGRFVVGVNVTAPNGSRGDAVTTLNVTAGPSLYVLLEAKPNAITLSQSSSIVTVVVPAGSNDTYVYSTLPPGCTGTNASSFSCTPSEVGHFVVGVNVTAPNGSRGDAVATLDVTQNSTGPGGNGNSNPTTNSLWWIVLLVIAAIVILLGFLISRRRQRAPPPPPPSFSPPPPPSPPPSSPPP
jgi:hypothetical protein